MIGTTNLDAQRQVIWNMGEIAAAAGRDPEAAQLFRDVLLASASIPGIFPPVHVKVRVGDRVFEEMHVDGGPTRQVFLAPAQFSLRTFDSLYPQPPIRRVYVVRNGKLAPAYEAVQANTLAISARSLFTVTKNQGIGDINRIYAMTQRDGAEFRLASIPASFTAESKQSFDPTYMKALFDVGFRVGLAGKAWVRTPPEAVAVPSARPSSVEKPRVRPRIDRRIRNPNSRTHAPQRCDAPAESRAPVASVVVLGAAVMPAGPCPARMAARLVALRLRRVPVVSRLRRTGHRRGHPVACDACAGSVQAQPARPGHAGAQPRGGRGAGLRAVAVCLCPATPPAH